MIYQISFIRFSKRKIFILDPIYINVSIIATQIGACKSIMVTLATKIELALKHNSLEHNINLTSKLKQEIKDRIRDTWKQNYHVVITKF